MQSASWGGTVDPSYSSENYLLFPFVSFICWLSICFFPIYSEYVCFPSTSCAEFDFFGERNSTRNFHKGFWKRIKPGKLKRVQNCPFVGCERFSGPLKNGIKKVVVVGVDPYFGKVQGFCELLIFAMYFVNFAIEGIERFFERLG